MALRSPPPQLLPKPVIRTKPRIIPRGISGEGQRQQGSVSPVQVLPLSRSPVDRPVPRPTEFRKPLPPANKPQLPQRVEHNGLKHSSSSPSQQRGVGNYEQLDGFFSEQRKRLKSAQKEALQRVLQDNRRQNDALMKEFLRGEQQCQSSVLKITSNNTTASDEVVSPTDRQPSDYIEPLSQFDYEYMDPIELGTSRVVPPAELKRTSTDPDAKPIVTKVTRNHNKFSKSSSSWFDCSLLRYEDAIRLADNSRIIIQGPDEFLFIGPTGIKMVTNCLPLFYIRPTGHEDDAFSKTYSNLQVKHELVRSSSASAVDEMYDYARPEVTVARHNNLCRKNSDPVAVVSATNVIQTPQSNGVHSTAAAVANIERRPPVPKPRTTTLAKMERCKSETDLLDSGDKDSCAPCPYETASVTFNSSAEKLYRPGSTSPTVTGELPPVPSTFKLHFRSHCGWLVKLSKQKGLFGADKWQKRYFVLNGNRLFYFKKYGDSQPRGSIELLPGSWCTAVTQGTPKKRDAQFNAQGSTDSIGIVSVLRCIALHRPSNYSYPLCRIIGSNGANAAESFRGHTLSMSDPEYGSRTFYFVTSSDTEQQEWIDAINANIKAHQLSKDALSLACKELEIILGAVKADITKLQPDLSRILALTHIKRQAVRNKSPSPV
ncbi:uncharacterized protein [Dysidea avara]|uniref:uncharacterized protein isoform X2 n=1 Tax=Dysidea avara TaxID=196820 RepID=UPI0033229521